jgi:pimeloyl-ACP methyl ester carboxylesterase
MANLRNVVVVPGLPGTEEAYEPILPYLRDYNVKIVRYPLTLDQRFSAVAEHVARVVDFDRFHVVGDSYGGPVSLELAQAIPNRVASLALTGAFTSSLHPRFIRFLPLKAMLSLGVPSFYVKKTLINDSSDEKAKVVTSTVNAVPTALLAQRFVNCACVEPNFAPRVRCPMLSIRGSGDAVALKRHAEEISAKYPHSTSIEIEGPHLLFLMRPQELSVVLRDFFDRAADAQSLEDRSAPSPPAPEQAVRARAPRGSDAPPPP